MEKEFTPSNNMATVPSLSGEKEVGFEYKPQEDGLWKISLGGKNALIKQADLFALVFYAADTDQVDKLTPIRNTEVRVYHRIHKIKLLKNMRKGEFVYAKCEVSVPTIIEEGFKGILEKKKKSSILLPFDKI